MHIVTSLTVSESKRLIARGVASADFVQRAMDEGTLALGSGTTNGYVAEELLGERVDKQAFVTGRTLPGNYAGPKLTYDSGHDLVIRNGERVDTTVKDVLPELKTGDVVIKGANALNYDRQQAAVLIGHPTGGNVGAALGIVMARRCCYLHPVGLEKNMSADLHEVADRINRSTTGKGPTLWVTPGRIFTEIEALCVLAGVEAVQCGAGGVGGAEGAVWLAIYGDKAVLDKAAEVLDGVRGEPPFVEE